MQVTPPPLVVRALPGDPARRARRRRRARPARRRSSAPRTAQDLRLLATELVANAVRHTGVADGTVEVQLRLAGDRVHLSVIDDGPGLRRCPSGPLVAPEGPGGWGLYLVDRCAVRWGTERGERHRVWLELERQDAA